MEYRRKITKEEREFNKFAKQICGRANFERVVSSDNIWREQYFSLAKKDKGSYRNMTIRILSRYYNTVTDEEEICKRINEIANEIKENVKRQIITEKILENVYDITRLKLGTNKEPTIAKYSDHNDIYLKTRYEKYSSRCKYNKVVRIPIVEIKKGYTLRYIDGKYVFIKKGKIDRHKPTKIEFVSQGKKYTDIWLTDGLLYRGEIYENLTAKAVKEAYKSAVLASKRYTNELFEKASKVSVNYLDSIKSGNCKNGTECFANLLSRYIKDESVKDYDNYTLSGTDLIKYARALDYSLYYIKRIIDYKFEQMKYKKVAK